MLLFSGPMFDCTGYSVAARSVVKILRSEAIPFRIVPQPDWSVLGVKLPWDEVEFYKSAVAMEQDKDHFKACYTMQKNFLGAFPGPKFVHTMFETDQCPADWIVDLNKAQAVLIPSRFVMKAFSNSGVGNIQYMPLFVDTDVFTPNAPKYIRGSEFKFMYVADLNARKNIDMLVYAFFNTFRNSKDVVLILKLYIQREQRLREFMERMKSIRYSFGGSKYPRILVWPNIFPEASMPGFINSCDCYVSTSHGEGFGLPLLYAMSCAKPVISINWSGPADYIDQDCAMVLNSQIAPVPYPILQQNKNFFGHNWAEPSTEHLYALLRYAVENKMQARQLGKAAREKVISLYSYPVVAKLMVDFLRERSLVNEAS